MLLMYVKPPWFLGSEMLLELGMTPVPPSQLPQSGERWSTSTDADFAAIYSCWKQLADLQNQMNQHLSTRCRAGWDCWPFWVPGRGTVARAVNQNYGWWFHGPSWFMLVLAYPKKFLGWKKRWGYQKVGALIIRCLKTKNHWNQWG